MSTDGQPDTRTAPTWPGDRDQREQVVRFLHAHRAGEIAHLNGPLLEHLERTELLLSPWGCSETASLAGLCHAVYGTDGFPHDFARR